MWIYNHLTRDHVLVYPCIRCCFCIILVIHSGTKQELVGSSSRAFIIGRNGLSSKVELDEEHENVH